MVYPGTSVLPESYSTYSRSAVCDVNVCWYDTMELSLLNHSTVWSRWDPLLLWSKSCVSAIVLP